MNRRLTIRLFGAETGKCLPLANDVDIARSAATGLSPLVQTAKKLGNLVLIHTEKKRFLEEQKVRSLEAIIANKCPDIDLAAIASVRQHVDSSNSVPPVCQSSTVETQLPEQADSRSHSTLTKQANNYFFLPLTALTILQSNSIGGNISVGSFKTRTIGH
ncbi:hypothetical protein TrVFT333_010589 [Trichoderma virens FT-333]|nr:hypothetical protein TrVFT333_010589 [Trichoderma virens FT-333]